MAMMIKPVIASFLRIDYFVADAIYEVKDFSGNTLTEPNLFS